MVVSEREGCCRQCTCLAGHPTPLSPLLALARPGPSTSAPSGGGGGGGRKRQRLYPDHLSAVEVSAGVKAGRLHQVRGWGCFHVSPSPPPPPNRGMRGPLPRMVHRPLVECVPAPAPQLAHTCVPSAPPAFTRAPKPQPTTPAALQGSLRVNRFNCWEAWVGSDAVGQDILVSGRIDMNRAMDGAWGSLV